MAAILWTIVILDRCQAPFLSLLAVLVVTLGFGPAGSSWAQGVSETGFEIEDGGVKRRFVVALDALSVRTDKGLEVQSVMAADLAALMSQAKTVRQSKVHQEVGLILVPAEGEPSEPNRRHVTNQILVRLATGIEPKRLASQLGLRVAPLPVPATDLALLEARSSEAALAAMQALRAMEGVVQADVVLARQRQRKFVPNDPLYPQQWHHRNTTQAGGALWVDTGITEVWDDYRGAGLTISIVDDGVQHAHPDLQARYDTTLDFDFNSNDDDATPVDLTNDDHGTACAGVAAGVGNNGIGVAGAAFEATMTGVRLIAAANTDADEAGAMALHNDVIDVVSNSWGVPDSGSELGGFGPLGQAALANGVTNGRGGKGVIYVFAGGNGLEAADNSNYDSYANAIETIAVGAISQLGSQSWYSEPGANLHVSAPSSGGGTQITTTDLVGDSGSNTTAVGDADLADRDYRETFGGTSSACPLVAGICALMLEANPNLGWRDVQEILIASARKIHHADPGWSTNGAGFSFNHKYGAGMVDAPAAIALAKNWSNLGAIATGEVVESNLNLAIPDNDPNGITGTLSVSQPGFRIEQVALTVNATHTARGDLEIILTSPSGMVSRLAELHYDGNDDYAWTFTSVRHWGESASGDWTVKIADRAGSDVGTLTSLTLKLYGSQLATSARMAATSATLQTEANLPSNAAADPGESVTFDINLTNIGAASTNTLTATLMATGGITPVGPASQDYGAIAIGGSASRTFSFTTQGTNGGSATALLRLADGGTFLGWARIDIPLGKAQQGEFSGGQIAIIDQSAGSPSPSTASASGLSGRLQHVACSINGFSHSYPEDVTIGLGNPGSFMAVLFSSSSPVAVANASISFDDNAEVPFVPVASFPTTGSFRTFDLYGTGTSLTNVPPGTVPAYTLGEFYGREINGDWRLFVQDFGAGDVGLIDSWSVALTAVDCTDNVFFASRVPGAAETDGQVEITVIRTGGKEGTATVAYSIAGGTAESGVDFTATDGTLTFEAGEHEKTFAITVAEDDAVEGDETILLTLSAPTGDTILGTDMTATLTLADSTPAGFLAWQEEEDFGPANESGLLDDPNNDGTPNLACYAFGIPAYPEVAQVMTPGTGTSGLPHLDRTGNGTSQRLRMEFVRRKVSPPSGLTYRPQFGNELTSGQPGSFADATETPAVTSIDDTWERVVIEDEVHGAERRFGRVLIEYSPPTP